MHDHPETKFVWNGDVALAYQVLGEGEPDLLYLQGWISNLELNWEHPIVARFLRGLARSRRLIMVDPRGIGVTERSSPADVAPLETIMDDLAVVLDAVGSSSTAILATNELGMVANMFAATYPERTLGVIVFEASANWLWSPETPWEWTEERFAEQEDSGPSHLVPEGCVRGRSGIDAVARGRPPVRRVVVSVHAAVCGTGLCRWPYPGSTCAPTFDRSCRPSTCPCSSSIARATPSPAGASSARYLADHIAGAKRRELPGTEAFIWTGDQGAVLGAIDEFLEALLQEQAELDRVLATVLFVDVVASTEALVASGDRRWRGPPRTAPSDGSLAARSVPRDGGGHGG